MKVLIVLDIDIDIDIDIDEDTWRATYGERASMDLEVAEYVYRVVAFSDRMTACGADVHQK